MKTITDIGQQIKHVVKQTDPSAIAILYGSRATGKATKDSDWDILILLNKPNIALSDEQAFRHKLYDVELMTGEPISTFVYTIDDWHTRMSVTPIYQEIQKHGITL